MVPYNRDSVYLPKTYLPPAPPLPMIENAWPQDGDWIICYVYSEATPDEKKWTLHLRSQLLPCLDSAEIKGMVAGTYSVTAKLLIEKDGTVTEANLTNTVGFGLDSCIVKALITGPKWSPKFERKAVASIQTQKVIFVIPDRTEPF